MRIMKSISTMQQYTMQLRKNDQSIGFVPTMGALHDGHRALIGAARRNNTIAMVSLFVNPPQFSPREDFQRYPRTFQKDRRLCEDAGVDVLFIPNGKTMYPGGFQTTVLVGKITREYEGLSRPTHFEGVATVVTKLCHIVSPDRVYFGQKDYQQGIVVRQMLADLNMPIKLVLWSTVREPDGLAMSSRNALLKPNQRVAAAVVYRALQEGARCVRAGERTGTRVQGVIERVLKTELSVNVDYIGIMHPQTLEVMRTLRGRVVLAIAVYVGHTRLIDNVIVRVPAR